MPPLDQDRTEGMPPVAEVEDGDIHISEPNAPPQKEASTENN